MDAKEILDGWEEGELSINDVADEMESEGLALDVVASYRGIVAEDGVWQGRLATEVEEAEDALIEALRKLAEN